ncbi:MAG: HPr family phosphocarrier protein [Candidatus Microbacterium colombiense]|nr:MAG: HPr family phosphocarrier protein [Microbacterium sp.]
MLRRHVIISAHNGVHARPVAELVRVVQAHPDAVTLRTADGAVVDLSSVLAVMDLALAPGDAVVLETRDSAGGAAVLDTLSEVLDPRH